MANPSASRRAVERGTWGCAGPALCAAGALVLAACGGGGAHPGGGVGAIDAGLADAGGMDAGDVPTADGGSLADQGHDAGPPADGGDPGSKGDPYNFAPPGRIVRPVAVQSTSGAVTNAGAVLTGKPTTLSGAGAQIVLDFGKEVGGILSLELAGATAPTQLGVAFSESSLYVGPNSDNSAGGGSSDGALSLTVTGATSWTSDARYLRGGFRYVTLFVAAGGSVDVSDVALAFTPDPARAVPNRYPNYFYSNDDLLNRIWYGGAYTVQTNIIGNRQGRTPPAPSANWDNSATVGEVGDVVVVDGAKRDRTVWPGDLAVSLPSEYAALGDIEAAKNAIVTLFHHQHGDGHLQWCGPPWNLDPGSDTYHLWTLHGTWLAWLYSGDKAWLDGVWPSYRTALGYVTAKIDANGLLNVTGTADWGPRVDQGGENIEANAILYAVLQGGVALANAEGDSASAASWATLATNLKGAAHAWLWDASVGAYRDNPGSNLHPQDGNALAVWFGLVDDPAAARGLSAVHAANWNAIGSITPEWGQISTFVGSMELQSHFVAGEDQRGLELMRTMWGYMLMQPTGPQSTFWESFTTDGTFDSNGNGPAPSASFTSLAHGWGTGPTSALTFYVLGVGPDGVAGQSYHVVPHPGDLTHVEGRLTFAPSHAVLVAWDADAGCHSFTLSVDARGHAGSVGTLAVPRRGAAHTVSINGAAAWDGARFLGANGVAGAHQDDAYIYFTGAQPGQYTLAWSDGTACPPASERWRFCAPENGQCTVTGTQRVRYGRDGHWVYRIVDGSAGSIGCDSATFGRDPIDGTVKLCQASSLLYTACAAEGATCAFSGTKEVRFGANGQWISRMATDGVTCNAATFGLDPLPNVVKSCEYR